MTMVRVTINDGDRRVGAMVKALAVEVSGFQSVKGATKDFLRDNGHYVFTFPDESKAHEFVGNVETYLVGRARAHLCDCPTVVVVCLPDERAVTS